MKGKKVIRSQIKKQALMHQVVPRKVILSFKKYQEIIHESTEITKNNRLCMILINNSPINLLMNLLINSLMNLSINSLMNLLINSLMNLLKNSLMNL